MTTHSTAGTFEAAPRPQLAPAARTHSLTKLYGSGPSAVRALDDVSIEFAVGQLTAVMGPSGSGKSTLMHCLAGLDTPTSGRVWLGDTDLTGLGDRALTLLRRRRVGFVFQSLNLLPMLSAQQNMLLPLRLAGRRPDREWMTHVIEALRLADRLDHRPSELSGGQQQRVAVARALLTRPDVIFADEPTGALDSQTGAQMLSFLRTSVRELDQTVVMVTHDPRAATYADRVVLLADGKVAGELTDPDPDAVLDAMRTMGA
ncbi:MAG: ABC transporter ATP-binding protein [Intrasporangium sp.]|uniref:ABC transporter ATP-binding protein n=1 Tax=Intrasporangium sp. TaxID=1925024 RepID=UPI002649198D|nr:ABC transporter ATP-binding protein [Intrasporangium sp.]MDN5796320.1 ABC transporter ATP-binding protein [Intrasporangium sp.]